MRKFLLATVSLAAFGTAPAFGADLDFAPAPSTWSGPYVGVNAGIAFLKDSLSSNAAITSSNQSDTGFIGGAQAGWNFQSNNLVFGLEGDINYLNVKSSMTVAGGSFSADYDWLATLRARVGLTALSDSTLFYVTGGLALTGLDMSGIAGAAAVVTASQSKVLAGWTIGGGVEHEFAKDWTVKAEYLYANFEAKNLSVGAVTYGVKPDMHIVRIGLNRRF